MRSNKLATLTLFALTLLSPHVLAAEPTREPLWELALGGYGTYNADYPGASGSSGNLLLLPFPIFHGKFLRLGEDTERPIWAQIFAGDHVRLSIDTEFSFGAKSKDIPERQGMPDLNPIFELGPELELRLSNNPEQTGNTFLALQARPAVTFDGFNPGFQGMAYSPELRFVRYFDQPGRRLKIRLTSTFISSGYARYYYSVDEPYAVTERPAYDAKGGYMGTTVGISFNQPVTDRFDIYLAARYSILDGARNESSPLFTDSRSPIAVVAFIYRFWGSRKQGASEQ